MGRSGIVCALALIALGGCGSRTSSPQACMEAQPSDVLQALAGAPGRVALADGTLLSQCVQRTTDEDRLQALGATLSATADTLAPRMTSSDAAAFQLGFLIGATERGAAASAGFQEELMHRIASSAGLDGGPRREQLLRGRAAGRRDG